MATYSTPFDRDAAVFIGANMRPWDRKEIFATRWTDNPEDLADDLDRVNGFKWIAWMDGVPAAIIGACCPWPGMWSPWCFGTDKFANVALLLTRIGKRAIIPAARKHGGRILECKSLDGHTDAQGWLERCFGFERVGTHTKYGREGETFHTYRLEL